VPGLFIVLVDEPGRDLRALPGFFHDADDAVHEHVSFQEHPEAARFLVAQVVGQVGPVHPLDGQEARSRPIALPSLLLPRDKTGARSAGPAFPCRCLPVYRAREKVGVSSSSRSTWSVEPRCVPCRLTCRIGRSRRSFSTLAGPSALCAPICLSFAAVTGGVRASCLCYQPGQRHVKAQIHYA
jgi:hypothetical protein